ncbi:MAG TPA: GGDEF domain-containing phosphodiesterase [Devosiaceae bacterium]
MLREIAAYPDEPVAKPGLDVPDIAQLARLGAEAMQLIGRYDHVTRLPNRVEFLEHFAELRGRRGEDRILVLVTLADSRHYSEIQRALGHTFADDFIRAGAGTIGKLLPPDVTLYHVNALSVAFVIAVDPGETIPAIVEDIATTFSQPLYCDDIPIRTRVGTGLLPLRDDVTDGAEALRATLAAALDSHNVAAGFAFYNHRTDAAQIRAFRLLTDLPAALSASDQLSLHFQPRVELATGRCLGAEALLRWNHPQLGPISPGEFVPLAEQTSFITPLTDWVFDTALTHARRFSDIGHPLRMSVNASPLNLSEHGFDERLLDLCLLHGVGPEQMELEFTEGVLASDSARTTGHLERLRAAGMEVSIDDFGSGYSNLSYLMRIPADVLKIDQSFIKAMGTPQNDFLVRQIITLAKGFGLRICAEGIETANTYNALAAMQCDEGQGYLMARPMPAPAFEKWFARTLRTPFTTA